MMTITKTSVARLADLTKLLAEAEAKLKHPNDQIATEDPQLRDKDAQLAAKDEALRYESVQLAQLDQDIQQVLRIGVLEREIKEEKPKRARIVFDDGASITDLKTANMSETINTDTAHLTDLKAQIAAAEAKLKSLNDEIQNKDTEIDNKTTVLSQLDHDIQQVLNILPIEKSRKKLSVEVEVTVEEDNGSSVSSVSSSADETVSYMSISTSTWEAWGLRL
ncbi:hypothetical protein EDC01DRAFT_746983 [Geopyxis carbonaria]|nr:hypothetical protein EDC01DRAFT_746983 [Geopyxis carbonaria]